MCNWYVNNDIHGMLAVDRYGASARLNSQRRLLTLSESRFSIAVVVSNLLLLTHNTVVACFVDLIRTYFCCIYAVYLSQCRVIGTL